MSVEASNYVEAMKQWREVLGKVYDNVSFYDEVRQAIESIDQAIARAERSAEGTLEAEKHSATHEEPVATLEQLEQEIYENTREFVSYRVMQWMLKRYYTHPQPKENT